MIDDAQLDMLVDGELSEQQRRDLLSRLSEEPDGWRRCALAFLEAQSWREAMQTAEHESHNPPAVAPSKTQHLRRRRWLTISAMAACFLLAFASGMAIDRTARRPPDPAPVTATPTHVAEARPETPTPKEEEIAIAELAPAATEVNVPYHYVSILAEDPASGKHESIRLPVVPQEYLGEGWPDRLPAVLPNRVVRSLQRRGHDVVQHRRLIPFQAADGSRVVFPVDEVEFVPVANRGYQ